jgi:hypothetical protein
MFRIDSLLSISKMAGKRIKVRGTNHKNRGTSLKRGEN